MSQNETPSKKTPQKRGPKSKITSAKASKMIELASKGATDEQVADILRVSVGTVSNWQKRDEELLLAYRQAKAQANEMVESALFRKAMGYEQVSTKLFFDSKSLTVIKEDYIEKFPPDTPAALAYLHNRDPERWKQKMEVVSKNTNIDISIESPEEQLERLKIMIKDETNG